MNEIRERVRDIAVEVVNEVDGENIQSVAAGISFELLIIIKGREVVLRIRCFLSDLEFELADVVENGESQMARYENEPSIEQQVRRLNRLFEDRLRRAGFRDRNLLRRNL